MVELVALETVDALAIENLLDAAFGPDRKGRTAYRIRRGTKQIESLSFGLVDGEQLIGSIQCWPVKLVTRGGETPLILVGPVAVHPEMQKGGFGHLLMNAMLAAAKKMDEPAMVMIGDAEYYGRFGFSADATGGWSLPGPWMAHRLLLRNPAKHQLPQQGLLRTTAR